MMTYDRDRCAQNVHSVVETRAPQPREIPLTSTSGQITRAADIKRHHSEARGMHTNLERGCVFQVL